MSSVPSVRMPDGPVSMLDPSEYRPEYKKTEEYRNYRIGLTPDRVVKTYKLMHTSQTLGFAREKLRTWGSLSHAEMTAKDVLCALSEFVDLSDPDADFANSYHGFQTAEGIRAKHPDKEWFQVTGLIHDIGKILAVWDEPQWAVVGDTYPLGCAPSDTIVFGVDSFNENPDMKNPDINTKYGIYSPNCGLDNVVMSWGHDEYLYRVLKGNTCYLPEEALYIIRFHSFYPWHTSGAYEYLCDNKDSEMFRWVKEFNKFDLYSKCPDLPDVEELLPYYENLLQKYLPGKLKF